MNVVNQTDHLDQEPSNRGSVPRWIAILIGLIFWIVGIPLIYGVGPLALSLITPHYGWTDGQPSLWNFLGLIPVLVGSACLIWIMVLHFARAPERVELEPTPSYLLRRGPYTFSRHPMYLCELMLLFGWVVFYGSLAVLVALAVAGVFFNFVKIPQEERTLEARFGEAYREYRSRVPRWFGKVGG